MLVSHRKAGANTAQIFRVTAPLTEGEQLTDGADPVVRATYEPRTGAYIVFERAAGGNEVGQLYRLPLNVAGAQPVLLTHPDERHAFNTWLRKSGQMIYSSVPIDRTAQGGTRSKITTTFWLMDPLQPEGRRKLAELDGGGWSAGRPSPDERQVSLTRYLSANESQVWLMDLASGATRQTPAEGVRLTHALVLPAGGASGSLANPTGFGSFTSGVATGTTFNWSEVGIITLTPSVADADYLGTGDVTGTASGNVGRFVPAGFALSNPVVTHRVAAACSPASAFTYLDENFQLAFTLTAQSASGTTTTNYEGSFAKLALGTPNVFGLAGIQGTTTFKPGVRLNPVSSAGTWSKGVAANTTLVANVPRATSADGPFATAQFGLAAVDTDSVGMRTLNLDTDSPANGADATLVGSIPLRHGRLRLQNAIGAANRALALPVAAQYWNGSAFTTNDLDSCTRINSANLSFGNLRKTLTTADLAMSPTSGSYADTQRYLQALERELPGLRWGDLRLVGGDGSEPPRLQVQLFLLKVQP
ncbi:hypothetical protein OSTOST_11921 [Ostertagia ostertagi]